MAGVRIQRSKLGRLLACVIVLVAVPPLIGCSSTGGPSGGPGRAVVKSAHCSIRDMGAYYDVVLDYTGGTAPRTIGQEYGQLMKRILPNVESLLDSYLAQLPACGVSYSEMLSRVAAIKPQVDAAYRDEIEGIASTFSGGAVDTPGDHKVSVNELYLVNLVPDVARPTECSAISVFGARSATGHTMTARLLDWPLTGPLPRCQAVVTIRNGAHSVCLVGYLGFQAALTAFNQSGIFAAVLDSDTAKPYPGATGKRSYPLDLRHAVEQNTTVAAVAAYLVGASRPYAFDHDVLLSDATTSQVLENDLVSGGPLARTRRTASSLLNPGVSWGLPNALGCVNSFVLKGNFDNHTINPYNFGRWGSIKTQVKARGSQVILSQLKSMAAYHATTLAHWHPGDLYTDFNQMIVIFQPDTHTGEVAFRPRTGSLPETPTYVPLPTHF